MDTEVAVQVVAAIEQVDSGQAVKRGKTLERIARLQAYVDDGYRGGWAVTGVPHWYRYGDGDCAPCVGQTPR